MRPTAPLVAALPSHLLAHLAVLVARDLFAALLDDTTHSTTPFLDAFVRKSAPSIAQSPYPAKLGRRFVEVVGGAILLGCADVAPQAPERRAA